MPRAPKARTLKIFLVGEGPNDIGGLFSPPPYATDEPGFLQPLLLRLAGRGLRFSGQRVAALPKKPIGRAGDAFARKGLIAASIAADDAADALVIVHDVDRGPGRSGQRAALERMRRMQSAFWQGVEEANTTLRAIVGTPLHTIEAWALGDLKAVQAVARTQTAIALPKPPEMLWGDPHAPDSNHPKRVLHRQFRNAPGTAEYAGIAKRADLDVMADNCPESFGPFADSVRTELLRPDNSAS